MSVRILTGDCRELLATLDAESVQTCVTSPPYFALRDYGVAGQIGLEKQWPDYVAVLVAAFREVRRVLRNDGTLWLNLGDSYATGGGSVGEAHGGGKQGESWKLRGLMTPANRMPQPGLKPKDLMLIPARVAIALQDDGWYVRSDIVWAKPNPMPESVTDRPTKSHEYLFLLSKRPTYYYDAAAIAEPLSDSSRNDRRLRRDESDIESERADRGLPNGKQPSRGGDFLKPRRSGNKERKPGSARGCPEGSGSNVCGSVPWEGITRNARTVWTIATQPFKDAHFATFPPALIEPCILAGSKRGDLVLDPFGGAGTTGLVADRLGRDAVLIELSPAYSEMARRRIHGDAPLFAEVSQ
jgi:DNA modification methylase